MVLNEIYISISSLYEKVDRFVVECDVIDYTSDRGKDSALLKYGRGPSKTQQQQPRTKKPISWT